MLPTNNLHLNDVIADTAAAFYAALDRPMISLNIKEFGTVTQLGGGIVRARGLASVTADEVVVFPGGIQGIAIDLIPGEVGIMLLGESDDLTAGDEVFASGRIADAPVGDALLGRVVDATGKALDHGAPLDRLERRPIERAAPPIIDRAPVNVPLQTGIKAIDALIPIGRGQRELIVGDRQTGKTAVAVDTILNQVDKGVVCIYCAIGQRGTAVAQVVDALRHAGAMAYTIVVVGSGEDPPGLQFVTPYAATTMAEFFMDQSRDVLIVYDDLTRHARAYRELSLLLRRPPGREAFPGDIFYIHSRLLERSTRLHERAGGGSLTALPIAETQAQDIAAYIPTNLISITDGQIYLSPRLFHKGHLPAIDVGMSVSRVGGKTQFPAFRSVANELRLAYAQFEELETFARFATRLDEKTREIIEHGRRVREILKQAERQPLRASAQIAVLKAVTSGLLDALPIELAAAASQRIGERMCEEQAALCEHIELGNTLTEDQWQQVLDVARNTLQVTGGRADGIA